MIDKHKSALLGAVAAVTLLSAGPVAAEVIGGVEIEPGGFVITRAETWGSLANDVGERLSGFGRVLSLNHDNDFCAGCELTFTFEDYIVTEISDEGDAIAHEGGRLRFYVDQSPDFNKNSGLATASDGDLWLELSGLSFTDPETGLTGTLIGTGIGFDTDQPTGFGDGRLQLVQNLDALATEFFTEFAQPFTFTTNLQQRGLGTELFPLTGSATMTARQGGAEIPEPATLGLLGAGLVGLGMIRRRRR